MQKWIQAALLVYRHLIIYVCGLTPTCTITFYIRKHIHDEILSPYLRIGESNLAGSRLDQDVDGCFVPDRSEGLSERKWNRANQDTHVFCR